MTSQGQAIYEASQRLMSATELFKHQAGELKNQLRGEFLLGFIGNTITDISSPVRNALDAFISHDGDDTLRVEIGSPNQLEQQILDGRLHIGIGTFPVKVQGLEYHPLYEDTHSDYTYLLQQMYSSYVAPLLYQSRSYTYESPIIIMPKSLFVHMQCTCAEADLSITLYNEDSYAIKILNFKGYDLVESWNGDGTKLCLNLIELVTNKLDISNEGHLLISFSVKNGFVISEKVFLEYE